MEPRNLNHSITIDGEKHTVKPHESYSNKFKNRPRRFNKAAIETYCIYCNSKHELTYSGNFPLNISFLCNCCNNENKLLTRFDGQRTTYHPNDVTKSLYNHARKKESYNIGKNLRAMGKPDIYKKISEYQLRTSVYKFISYSFPLILGFAISIVPHIISNMGYISISSSSSIWLVLAGLLSFFITLIPSLKLYESYDYRLKDNYIVNDSKISGSELYEDYLLLGFDSK